MSGMIGLNTKGFS